MSNKALGPTANSNTPGLSNSGVIGLTVFLLFCLFVFLCQKPRFRELVGPYLSRNSPACQHYPESQECKNWVFMDEHERAKWESEQLDEKSNFNHNADPLAAWKNLTDVPVGARFKLAPPLVHKSLEPSESAKTGSSSHE